MKILITTDLYTTKTNGVVTSVRNLTRELTAQGHDVRILTFSENGRSRVEGNVYYIGSASLERVYPNVRMPIRIRSRLVRQLIAWKPDVIHSQCEFFSYHFAKRIAKRTGAPIVHTYHTLYEQYTQYIVPSRRVGRQLCKYISKNRLKKARVIIAPTQKVEDALHGYGVRNKVRIVPSGIELRQHKARLTDDQRTRLRHELGIADDEVVLLNLGRLGNEKRVDELLLLFGGVKEKFPKLRFLIVGDGPARYSLETLTRLLKLEDRVRFTGMVSPTEVQNYYQMADIFVSASTSETQGLTYAEAAANGLPLLCRQDPCLDGLLIPGENGFAYTDAQSFYEGLTALLDTDARVRAGTKSRAIAEEFGCEVFGRRVEAIYEEALATT